MSTISEEAYRNRTKAFNYLAASIDRLGTAIAGHQPGVEKQPTLPLSDLEPVTQAPAPPPAPAPAPDPEPETSPEPKKLFSGEAQLLLTIVRYNGATTRDLTVLAGQKRGERSRSLKSLVQRGYIKYHGNTILATQDGKAALGHITPLPTGKAAQEHALSYLSAGHEEILRELILRSPRTLSELQVSAKLAASTLRSYLSWMETKRLIERDGEKVFLHDNLKA